MLAYAQEFSLVHEVGIGLRSIAQLIIIACSVLCAWC